MGRRVAAPLKNSQRDNAAAIQLAAIEVTSSGAAGVFAIVGAASRSLIISEATAPNTERAAAIRNDSWKASRAAIWLPAGPRIVSCAFKRLLSTVAMRATPKLAATCRFALKIALARPISCGFIVA